MPGPRSPRLFPQRLGILRGTGHEHLRGRIVFPVIAENGETETVYGRASDDGLLRCSVAISQQNLGS